MRKFLAVSLALFALMLALPSACDATGCIVRRAVVVHQAAVAVAVVPAVVVQPYYHSYYSYDANAADAKATKAEIAELRARMELAEARAELARVNGGQPAPIRAQAAPGTKPMPQAEGKEHPGTGVMRQACASCHESNVSKVKGGAFVMFNGGQLANLTDEQVDGCLKRIANGTMPKGGPPLSADKKAAILDFVFGE